MICKYKSVEFMQQSAFLTKLYEIKPFKVVQSPQNIKKQSVGSCLAATNNNLAPSLKTNNKSIQLQKKSSQNTSILLYDAGYSIKTEGDILHKNLNTNFGYSPLRQSQQNIPPIYRKSSNDSAKKVIKKFSNNQPASPHRITFPKKNQNIINSLYGSNTKTPNKQNRQPLGSMIQSQVYTSLSSSIDTLFSKIQKIKQQFQCPLSSSANKSQGNSVTRNLVQRQRPNTSRSKCLEIRSQISGYSPINVNNNNAISSMSTLSPLINDHNKNKQIGIRSQLNQSNEIISKPFCLMPNIIKKQQNAKAHGIDSQSINSFQLYAPPSAFANNINSSQSSISNLSNILPATCSYNNNHPHHNNINEISDKTRSIIDQINLMLDSSQKNNGNGKHNTITNQVYMRKQENINKNNNNYHPRIKKFKRINTYNFTQSQASQQQNNYYINNNNELQQFDEFDDEFVTIKLKSTQSQYPPHLTHQNSEEVPNAVISTSKDIKQQQFLSKYQNLGYRIEKPTYSQINKSQHHKQKLLFLHNEDSMHNRCLQVNQCPLTMRQFELGKCVGSGKFGDVHICKHKKTGFIFALKKIFKSTIKQYNMIQQFIQQLRIHYSLSNNNPNIAKLYAHFQDQYHIFLLMEYIQDGTLMSHLKQKQSFVSNIISQVLDAVQSLHRNNIAHRDIKPENILLTHGIAKLCDFGWSSLFKNEMRRTFCGTLDYVSPEMKDKGEYNTSVDLWSIGVLTFELLAGFPPHKKQIDKWKTRGANIKNKWKWDVQFPPQITIQARNFINKLLKQNPEQRISIRQCRQQQFIKKYSKNQSLNAITKQLNKIIS